MTHLARFKYDSDRRLFLGSCTCGWAAGSTHLRELELAASTHDLDEKEQTNAEERSA